MSKSDNTAASIGVSGALGVLFIGLKLGHIIDWPWLIAVVFLAVVGTIAAYSFFVSR